MSSVWWGQIHSGSSAKGLGLAIGAEEYVGAMTTVANHPGAANPVMEVSCRYRRQSREVAGRDRSAYWSGSVAKASKQWKR
jgi:hypothetical protein